jgi:NAD(P)-dependent dehydrogenase (short-subunit alcohol dehydrogenase family)
MNMLESGASFDDLRGKVVIVTGAAGGIGSATSRAFAAAGARVVVTDRAQEGLTALARELGSDADVIPVVADVTREADVERVVRTAVDSFGGVDVLDNNAGATNMAHVDQTVIDMEVDLWDQIFAINARGPMLFCKHTIPVMAARGGGAIVNISSGTSLAGAPAFTAYASSKGALNTLTKYVASAHGGQGVRCNAILPGIILREGLGVPEEMLVEYRKHHIVGRLGDPDDVARAVLFLASDLSSFITGQIFSVDGGFFAHLPIFSNPS